MFFKTCAEESDESGYFYSLCHRFEAIPPKDIHDEILKTRSVKK